MIALKAALCKRFIIYLSEGLGWDWIKIQEKRKTNFNSLFHSISCREAEQQHNKLCKKWLLPNLFLYAFTVFQLFLSNKKCSDIAYCHGGCHCSV